MSSRVFLPDDRPEASPVVWREVRPGGPGGVPKAAPEQAATPPPEPQPDWKALLAEAERKAGERVREAHAAGAREGEAAGRARASAEIKPAIDRLARSVEELANLRGRLRREAEADVVKLALAIARRVLRRELAVDPDALRGLVMAALEKTESQEIHRVRVHPTHAALLASCLGEAAGRRQVEIVADATREPGLLVFETERGNLDASVEAQLVEVERGLADRLRRNA